MLLRVRNAHELSHHSLMPVTMPCGHTVEGLLALSAERRSGKPVGDMVINEFASSIDLTKAAGSLLLLCSVARAREIA